MSVTLPNGAIISIASGLGSPVTVTAVTNASQAVVTTGAAHGYTTGDFVRFSSGWSRATEKVFRIAAASGSVLTLEGYDTSNTTTYPAGSGVGTVTKVTGWTQLSQVLSSSSSGGEQQFLDYQFLEADAQKRIPTFKNSAGLTFTVADDPTLAGYILASTANDDRAARPVKVSLPNGSLILYNCYISLNKTPTLTVNELMACEATMSMLNEPVRYAS